MCKSSGHWTRDKGPDSSGRLITWNLCSALNREIPEELADTRNVCGSCTRSTVDSAPERIWERGGRVWLLFYPLVENDLKIPPSNNTVFLMHDTPPPPRLKKATWHSSSLSTTDNTIIRPQIETTAVIHRAHKPHPGCGMAIFRSWVPSCLLMKSFFLMGGKGGGTTCAQGLDEINMVCEVGCGTRAAGLSGTLTPGLGGGTDATQESVSQQPHRPARRQHREGRGEEMCFKNIIK